MLFFKRKQVKVEHEAQEDASQLIVPCGWCGKNTNPMEDGFHLLHIAFGSTQERYCFCSDECYEAFRAMYPSRVHRNCYERDCEGCNDCLKRYDETSNEINILTKDYIRAKKQK